MNAAYMNATSAQQTQSSVMDSSSRYNQLSRRAYMAGHQATSQEVAASVMHQQNMYSIDNAAGAVGSQYLAAGGAVAGSTAYLAQANSAANNIYSPSYSNSTFYYQG